MVSRSTEYRKRKGLAQVGLDWDEQTWSNVMTSTGAGTKRAAVEELLRRLVAARKPERASKLACQEARAAALARLGDDDAL